MATPLVPSRAECSATVAAVQATLQGASRKLRLSWRRVCVDLLSVLCGLRPAAMLDYAVVPRSVMLQLAAEARTTSGPAGNCLVTAEHEGVMYFLHAPWLLRRLDDHTPASPSDSGVPRPQQHPRLVVFEEAAAVGGDTVVRWATAEEQQV